jgi:hypothetical protein
VRLIPETEKPRQQKLFSISPSFVVDDVVKSAEYCRDVLGDCNGYVLCFGEDVPK